MKRTVNTIDIDIEADEGKELYRASDGMRAKRVTRPIDSEEWIEIDEGAEMPSEAESAFARIEDALGDV